MTITCYTRTLGTLAPDKALLPERYHPAKEQKLQGSDSIPLYELVVEVRETVSPTSKKFPRHARFIIYDTSDAHEGFLRPKSELCKIADIGSTKKLFRPGDVLISRLRPYLRQVAFVPQDFSEEHGDVFLACSTEFYILRSKDSKRSIGFLVPFLLSKDAQEVLSLSQEGGHHPRFRTDTLMQLHVPRAILQQRDQLSTKVEKLASQHQIALKILAGLALECSRVPTSATPMRVGKRASRR